MKKMYSISKPTLILGGGISSSGKTTVFTKLITHLHDTFWINKDVINEAFMRNQSGDIIPGGITSDYYHQNVRFNPVLKILILGNPPQSTPGERISLSNSGSMPE